MVGTTSSEGFLVQRVVAIDQLVLSLCSVCVWVSLNSTTQCCPALQLLIRFLCEFVIVAFVGEHKFSDVPRISFLGYKFN